MLKERKAIFLILFAALLWGTTGTAQTFAPAGAHPVAIGAVRLAVGGFALLIFVLIQGNVNLRQWKIVPTILSAAGMAAYQPLFFSAVAITGVAVGTVVAIGSAPILAGMLEWMVKGKAPDRKWWFATLLALLGCLLLMTTEHEVSVAPFGVVMALGAGLSFAVYALLSKQLMERRAPEAVAAVIFTLSALFLSPLLWVYDLSWLLNVRGLGVALHLGLSATAIAYLFFARGLAGVPAATAVTLSLAEPLTAAVLGVFIVGERLTSTAWLGVALLLFGLGVLSYTPGKQKERG